MKFIFAAAIALFAGRGVPGAFAAPIEHAPRNRIAAILLQTSGVDHDGLAADLALRVPGTPIEPLRERTVGSTDEPVVYVGVTPTTKDHAFALTVVVSDGRAFDRLVTPGPDASAIEQRHFLARNIANLIHAIELANVQPDRAGVAMPTPAPQVAAPSCPPCPPSPAEPQPAPDTPRAPRVEVGLAPALVTLLGLGRPTDVDRFTAWGGALGLNVRLRNGATLVSDLRVSGRGHPLDARLIRFRLGLGAGYTWRPRAPASPFELEAAGLVTLEPWWVRFSGSRIAFDSRRIPALGGALRIAPGYRWRERRGLIALRVGLWAELAGSLVPSNGGQIAKISTDDGRPVFRLGGIELVGGVQTVIWLPIR